MAYLHCHSCGWSQDDFWREGGYNPISWLSDFEKDLFKEKIHLDSEYFADDIIPNQDEKGFWIRGKDFVAQELERVARNIRNMAIPTDEHWQAVKEGFKCPKCGSPEWDID